MWWGKQYYYDKIYKVNIKGTLSIHCLIRHQGWNIVVIIL